MTAVSNADSALALVYSGLKGIQGREPFPSMASFARPADATPYAAGDVISDSTSPRALAFPNCGRGGLLRNASIVVAQTGTIDLDLLVFDQEPTNHADNAALALVATDQTKLLGVFRFLQGARVNLGTNLEHYFAVSAGTDQGRAPISYTTLNTDTAARLWGLLVTRSGFTPISASKYTVRLSVERNVG